MNGEQFEKEVLRWLRSEGLEASLTKSTNDRGIDVIARKQNRVLAVQAKYYSTGNKVGSGTVQKTSGLLTRPDIDEAMIVTSSSFTSEAQKVADNRGVTLIPFDIDKDRRSVPESDDRPTRTPSERVEISRTERHKQRDPRIQFHLEKANASNPEMNIRGGNRRDSQETTESKSQPGRSIDNATSTAREDYSIPNSQTVTPADVEPGATLRGENLSNANLKSANLSGADLSHADLSNTNLSRANLSNSKLYEANLRNTTLSGADLSGATLKRATISGVDLSGTDLTNTVLPDSLSDAKYKKSDTNVSSADFCDASVNTESNNRRDSAQTTEPKPQPTSSTDNPTSTTRKNHSIPNSQTVTPADIEPGAILRGENLGNAILENADLSGADLAHADLSNANLNRADLSNSKLYEANLRNTTLSGADLSNATLKRATISEVDLSGVDLTNAVLPDSLSGVALQGADLSRLDLSDADLSSADLHDVDLSDANLTGVDLSNASLSGADLSNADLTDAMLPDSLSDATLQGAELAYNSISGERLQCPVCQEWRAEWRNGYPVECDSCGTHWQEVSKFLRTNRWKASEGPQDGDQKTAKQWRKMV